MIDNISSTVSLNRSLKGATVVVADDDRITRELLASILTRHGFEAETVDDGQAAVERVSQGNVDLVFFKCQVQGRSVRFSTFSCVDKCRII